MAAPVIEAPDDQTNVYTPEEERALTAQLELITTEVHGGRIAGRPLDLALICDLHSSLFDGIRGHAGRHRRPGRGSEHVIFGPHRSTSRDAVESELTALFERVRREERELSDDATFELSAIRMAVRAHADFIWIHPFEDGNGRVGRLVAGHILVRQGLRPVPMEAVKQEYTEALNWYYTRQDIDPLVDLYISLYPVDR